MEGEERRGGMQGKGSKEEEATQEPELDLYGSEITDEKSVQ